MDPTRSRCRGTRLPVLPVVLSSRLRHDEADPRRRQRRRRPREPRAGERVDRGARGSIGGRPARRAPRHDRGVGDGPLLDRRHPARVLEAEKQFFVDRLLTFLTSCEERRREEYEHSSWREFIDAEETSWEHQQVYGIGLTRCLVDADQGEQYADDRQYLHAAALRGRDAMALGGQDTERPNERGLDRSVGGVRGRGRRRVPSGVHGRANRVCGRPDHWRGDHA